MVHIDAFNVMPFTATIAENSFLVWVNGFSTNCKSILPCGRLSDNTTPLSIWNRRSTAITRIRMHISRRQYVSQLKWSKCITVIGKLPMEKCFLRAITLPRKPTWLLGPRELTKAWSRFKATSHTKLTLSFQKIVALTLVRCFLTWNKAPLC